MKEQWRAVVGYEGLYDVSTHGRVRRIIFHNGRFSKSRITMKSQNVRCGYKCVQLWKDGIGRTFLVHRLVLFSFAGPPPRLYQAAHIDGDRVNNKISNLAWATQKENEYHKLLHGRRVQGERQHNSKLTRKDVIEIRAIYASGNVTYFDLAKRYNCSFSHIGKLVRRKLWKHVAP